MRKFLSLVLALVMMMSLVTINAGAKEFTDGDDITYREAVDVISTIKVVDGYADGDFKPGNNLTRGAAAKIICNMILGPTTAAELHADTAPYRDVPVTSDFAGYIAYCQKEGIISGYADGSFRPAGTLTGYAFMKMLLGALGYDAEIEGYTGPNWSINVAKKAIGLGLNQSLEKTFNGVDFVTREEAALYAFNTLKADLVEYSSKITANVNGAEVVVGNSNATPQEWESQKTRSDNIYKDGLVQFAEQYFNKLVLTEDMDVFGRPDREWRYDGDDIGAYINMDLFKQEYTTKVTGRDLYDLLGSRTVDEYNFEIRVDGIETVDANKRTLDDAYFTEGNMLRGNTEKVGETGNGVLTQVFVDNDKDVETVWVAVINTYLAKATADYNEKKDEADYEVWSLENKNNATDPVLVKDPAAQSAKSEKVTLTVSGEDFDIEEVKENDIVLVRVADGAIQEILDPEVIDDAEITSFKKNSWVKADEQYDYASTAMYDDEVLDIYDLTNMKDTVYRIFLDPYGYAIGVEIVEDTAKYVFLTGIDGNSSNLRNKTADGNLIFTDGTMETAKINMEKSRALNESFTIGGEPYKAFKPGALWNTWCTYSVNSDGVYTLTEVANTGAQMNADDSGASRASAKRTTDKVGQGRNVDALSDATYTTLIDKKHISLNGLNGSLGDKNTTGDGTDSAYSKVYGNDDSVYINVGVSLITDATEENPHEGVTIEGTADHAVIIDDVDSVSTGVQSVSLKAYNHTFLNAAGKTTKIDGDTNGHQYAYGTYTLFDSDGFVIAAVVVGEDEGVSSKYAYAYDSEVSQESWDKEKKEWTWTKDVIIDGEEVTLTEKGDSLSELSAMRMNNWYEVKFKADETVKEVILIDPCDTSNGGATCSRPGHITHSAADGTAANAKDYIFCTDYATHIGSGDYPKFVGLIEMVEKAQEDNTSGKVVLFEDMYTGNTSGGIEGDGLTYTLSTAGTSLQVQNSTGVKVKGFAVSSNAKTVLVQDVQVLNSDGTVRDLKQMDSIEYFDGGRTGLERAVKKLNLNSNESGKYFRGFVSAVFENGVAQTVIIYEKLPNDVNWGDSNRPPVSRLSITVRNGQVIVTGITSETVEEIASAVKEQLIKDGYENIVIEVEDGAISGIKASKNGINYNLTPAGEIAIVDPAVTLAADKLTVEAITNAIFGDATGAEPALTVPQIKTAVEDAVNAALSTGVSASFTWDDVATVAAVNGAAAGDAGKTDGKAKVAIILSKGGKTENAALDLTVPAMAFANTIKGLNTAAIDAAKGATFTGIEVTNVNYANDDPSKAAIKQAIQADVDAAITAALTGASITGRTVTAEITVTAVSPATDEGGSGGTGDGNGANGDFTFSVALSCGTGTNEVTDNTTVANKTGTINFVPYTQP